MGTGKLIAIAVLILAGAVLAVGSGWAQCVDYRTTMPPIIGSVTFNGAAYEVAVQGNYAYVAANGFGLIVVDVSNPAAPAVVGQLGSSPWAWSIAVSGHYAYIADFNAGMDIIDIADPTAPVLVGTYNYAGAQTLDVAVQGNYAYLAVGGMGFFIVDCTNPAGPIRTAWVDTPGSAMTVAVDGNYAYVGDHYGTGVLIFDVTNPHGPYAVGWAHTPGQAYGLFASGHTVYLADGLSGLAVIDVTVPSAPTFVTVPLPDWGVAVVEQGGYARVAGGYAGLQIVDATDPAHPVLIGGRDTPGWGSGLDIGGGYVFFADEIGDLVILPDQCDLTVSAPSAAFPGELRLRVAPNPARGPATVRLELPGQARARAIVLDVAGRTVRRLLDGSFEAGVHTAVWDGRDESGRDVPPGAYYVNLVSSAGVKSERVVLVK